MRSLQRHEVESGSSSPPSRAAGRRSLTEGLRPRTAVAAPEPAAAPVQRRTVVRDLDAAFDFTGDIQRRAAPTTDAITAIAADGVAAAASPLPHGAAIQRAFGRHDISGVRAEVGGPAADAAGAIGASAYATGDRVAFAAAPDLHLAAHEAAHVVQQRGGVQLAGGVGAAGDRYEQHADQVADLVVAGRSAEAALDQLAGGAGGDRAVQRHDSPSHVRAGDSVPGADLIVQVGKDEVRFSPGECSALVDYIGDLNNLNRFTLVQLQTMKQLLRDRSEDVEDWDAATGGLYSVEAQDNEKHFAPAPGDDGMNFRDQFIHYYGQAIDRAKTTRRSPTELGRAQADAYTSEHYLQDAFSAGHQLAAKDIETAVAQHMGWLNSRTSAASIGHQVWARSADAIQHWGKLTITGWTPLTEDDFVLLAVVGALLKGAGGVTDAVRRFVHEDLDAGVEVMSKAHPQPWILRGDHGLGEDKTGPQAMQAALIAVRDRLKDVQPGDDGKAVATELFDFHCPTPTSTGRATVATAIDEATASQEAILAAVVDTMCATIGEVMAVVDASLPTVKKLTDLPSEPHPYPDMPDVGARPITGQPVGEPGGALPPTAAPITGQPVGEPGGALP